MKQGSSQNNYVNMCWSEIEPIRRKKKKMSKLRNKYNKTKYKFIATHHIAQGSRLEFIASASLIIMTILVFVFTVAHW